ncbi:MAG: restriction endonuclease subunit S, partial [Pseudomonadota bacterium]|nr:restriction endonuclease subunit S [Pseudomonadota bacterium]
FAFTSKHLLYGKLRPYLAKIARPTFAGICSTDILPVLPGPRLDRGYLAWYLLTPHMVAFANSRATGVNLPRMSPRTLAELKIPLPPISEQRRIAETLDKADALRAKRCAGLAQLDTLTQSIFLDMFGDPVTNPKQWPQADMSQVVYGEYGVKAGPFGSSLKKEHYTDKGYRVYGQEQLIAGRFDVGNYYIGEKKYRQLKTCAVAEGDVLISLVGSFGKILVVPRGIEEGIINPRLLKITPNRKLITPYFLAALLALSTIQSEFGRMSHGGTMGVLNAGLLKELRVILPPVDLQHDFLRRILAAQALRVVHETSLVQLDGLFASLQYRAFRGEL